MPKRECCVCGKGIEELDFYAVFPQGDICSACIVEKDIRVGEAAAGKRESRPKSKLLLFRRSFLGETG